MLVPVVGAFAEMSSDTELIADLIATALAADHIQFYSESAKQAKGMFKQRIRKAWGHTAHRGWARLQLDRRRDLIIHGPASHRTCPYTAGGLTEDELEHHNYHHPDRGGLPPKRALTVVITHAKSPPPPPVWGARQNSSRAAAYSKESDSVA